MEINGNKLKNRKKSCLYDGNDLLLAMLVTHMRIQALGILETNAALLAWENGTCQRVPMYQGLVRQQSLLAWKDLGTLAALVDFGILAFKDVQVGGACRG